MTNHELNAQVAEEVMGWIVLRSGPAPLYIIELPIKANAWLPVPDFSGSLDAAWQMEEEIERRELRYRYAQVLYAECLELNGGNWGLGFDRGLIWLLIHATPEQRCRAALEAVRER